MCRHASSRVCGPSGKYRAISGSPSSCAYASRSLWRNWRSNKRSVATSRGNSGPSCGLAIALHPGEPGVGRGQPRSRDAIRRARDVVEVELFAECDRVGVTAVLTADAHAQRRTRSPALLHCDAHEATHAVAVERLERVPLQDLVLHVLQKELALSVVARYTERCLREVVRAERKEL